MLAARDWAQSRRAQLDGLCPSSGTAKARWVAARQAPGSQHYMDHIRCGLERQSGSHLGAPSMRELHPLLQLAGWRSLDACSTAQRLTHGSALRLRGMLTGCSESGMQALSVCKVS